ncbi:MAG: DUF262 domain-containing protein [Bdellovibrionota bacterium]
MHEPAKISMYDLIERNAVFEIPDYQRNYDWKIENVKRLLEDIEKIIKKYKENPHQNYNHFFGVIIDVQEYRAGLKADEPTSYIIIDGQQRITTVMILLKALLVILNNKECDNEELLVKNNIKEILENKSEKYKIKLKQVSGDDEVFYTLMNVDKNDEYVLSNIESEICKNYKKCKLELNSWLEKGHRAKDILEAIKKLIVVEIMLDENDDPQVVFESVNSTGKSLSNSDLIRNFLLMGVVKKEDRERCYKKWQNIEESLVDDYWLNLFFFHLLIFKNNSIVKKKYLYEAFKKCYENADSKEDIIDDIYKYFDIYEFFIWGDQITSEYPDAIHIRLSKNAREYAQIRCYLDDILEIDQTTCYPFLLHIFEDYINNKIDFEIL